MTLTNGRAISQGARNDRSCPGNNSPMIAPQTMGSSDNPSGFAGRMLSSAPILTFPLVESQGALMAFSTRLGGCSPPPYDSMNLSASEGDELENVHHNLIVLGENLNIDPAAIRFCRQVHGDGAAIVDSVSSAPPMADSMITRVPGVFLAVKTADCVPIVLVDPVKRVAAAVHAGWKGTILRIARKTLRIMTSRFGANPSDVIACIGPSIGPCCYQVDERVLAPFRSRFPSPEQFIVQGSGSRETREAPPETTPAPGPARGRCDNSYPRFALDLAGANRSELVREGIPQANIFSTDLCTACRPDLLFSHRRDNGRTGRQAAIVGFRE